MQEMQTLKIFYQIDAWKWSLESVNIGVGEAITRSYKSI